MVCQMGCVAALWNGKDRQCLTANQNGTVISVTKESNDSIMKVHCKSMSKIPLQGLQIPLPLVAFHTAEMCIAQLLQRKESMIRGLSDGLCNRMFSNQNPSIPQNLPKSHDLNATHNKSSSTTTAIQKKNSSVLLR